MDEEAPTKIKGAGEIVICDSWRPPRLDEQLLVLALCAWVIVGLVMIVLGARKGRVLKGLVAYAVGSTALVVFMAGSAWWSCGPDMLTLHRFIRVAGGAAPVAAVMAGAGLVAWLIGRLLRPRKPAVA